ncbi:MAG: hypothetical protein R2794_11940 [Chitinophagales bacterium]
MTIRQNTTLFLEDYYPFGMVMPGRSYGAGSEGRYRFGYQGSLNDGELGDNTYSTFYRELDSRIARWWSDDSKKSGSESPYLIDHNNPIRFNDPKGDWPPGNDGSSVYGQIGAQLTLGGNSSSNMRFTAAVGGTAKFEGIQGDFSASLNLNLGGIGSNQGNTGNPQPIADFNISGGLTAGIGTAPGLTMNVFHNLSGNNVNTTYAGSASVGLTQTFSSMGGSQPGRNQTTGYVYLRGGPISLGTYNDLFSEYVGLPQNDSYYTGGFEIQGQFSEFNKLTVEYDAFTGVRPGGKTAYMGDDRNLYYTQPAAEQQYNNGQTSIRLTTNSYVIGISHIGNGRINGQWLQNYIHDNWKSEDECGKCLDPISRFLNTSTETFQLNLGIGQTW